jgi:hypothetical protein
MCIDTYAYVLVYTLSHSHVIASTFASFPPLCTHINAHAHAHAQIHTLTYTHIHEHAAAPVSGPVIDPEEPEDIKEVCRSVCG